MPSWETLLVMSFRMELEKLGKDVMIWFAFIYTTLSSPCFVPCLIFVQLGHICHQLEMCISAVLWWSYIPNVFRVVRKRGCLTQSLVDTVDKWVAKSLPVGGVIDGSPSCLGLRLASSIKKCILQPVEAWSFRLSIAHKTDTNNSWNYSIWFFPTGWLQWQLQQQSLLYVKVWSNFTIKRLNGTY